MAVRERERRPSAEAIHSISAWAPVDAPRTIGLEAAADSNAALWIDLDGAKASQRVEEITAHISPLCPGLEAEMVADLITPDQQPEGRRYADGAVRLASWFGVEARANDGSRGRGVAGSGGVLVFQPVELLASGQWLITC